MPLMRLLGSMLAATVVVVVVMTIGLNVWYSYKPKDEDQIEVRTIDMLGERERRDLADVLGDNDPPVPPSAVQPLALPSLERSPKQGFVQLEVSVTDDGSVDDIRVIAAFPPGVYEDQAVEAVRGRTLRPSPAGTTETRVEVIEFEVPESD